jgi:hypothetical protein
LATNVLSHWQKGSNPRFLMSTKTRYALPLCVLDKDCVLEYCVLLCIVCIREKLMLKILF